MINLHTWRWQKGIILKLISGLLLKLKVFVQRNSGSDVLIFLEHTAVIFTSRTAIDHFFRMAEELRDYRARQYEVFLHF
jgi:hypothetical protein